MQYQKNMYPRKTRHEKSRRIIYEVSYYFVVNGRFTPFNISNADIL
jgi:hypothetical protein